MTENIDFIPFVMEPARSATLTGVFYGSQA